MVSFHSVIPLMEEILHHLGCFSDPENKGQISTGTRRIPEPSSVIFFDFRKSKRGGFFFFYRGATDDITSGDNHSHATTCNGFWEDGVILF